jgi:hypothetical protein
MEDQNTISVVGEILPGDDNKLRNTAGNLKDATILFKSPGGDVVASINMGEFIHERRFATLVSERCSSGCALAWLAGSPRMILSGAHVGFHAAFFKESRQVSSAGNAVVGAYLARLGFNYDAIRYLTEAAPHLMEWLAPVNASQYGITYEIVSTDVPRSDSSPHLNLPECAKIKTPQTCRQFKPLTTYVPRSDFTSYLDLPECDKIKTTETCRVTSP